MPDMDLHQGAGLRRDIAPLGLRLLAVLSQNTAQATETLWQVCAQLQCLGYPVVVLDGTSAESDTAPGLAHLLVQPPWNGGSVALPALDGTDAASLAVLPALHGLAALARDAHVALHGTQHLHHPHPHPLQPLQALFQCYALVVLHAPVSTLASPLLEDLPTAPLLVLQPGADGVLEGYRQLKLLALHTGLASTVVCVAQPGDAEQQRHARDALHAVGSCAARHLGQRIGTTLLQAGDGSGLQRLALQLLEGAGALPAAPLASAWSPAPAPFAHAPMYSHVQAPSHFQPGH